MLPLFIICSAVSLLNRVLGNLASATVPEVSCDVGREGIRATSKVPEVILLLAKEGICPVDAEPAK